MKIIIATTPQPGHLNPLLTAGRLLIDAGHEVHVTSGSPFREKAEAIGARFTPLLPSADLDMANIDALFPQRKTLTPGPEQIRFDCERVFIDTIPAQFETLENILREFHADLILVDTLFAGTLPFLLGARPTRPKIVGLGVTFLPLHRDDHAPHFMGLLPTEEPSLLETYQQLATQVDKDFDSPIRAYTDTVLARLGASALPMPFFDALVTLPDLFLQPTVASFEYPRRDLPQSVHFIGALPLASSSLVTSDIHAALDSGKRVILVTQGTIANADLGQLIGPTLTALADRDDVMILATTGGRAISEIPADIPANALVTTFLPFDQIMPNVDVLVTNGGYGTVTQALSLGIPLAVAGLTEYKPEVAARVAWCGAGIDMRIDKATPAQISDAVDALLSDPRYKSRAVEIGGEFARADGPSQLCEWLVSLVDVRAEAEVDQ